MGIGRSTDAEQRRRVQTRLRAPKHWGEVTRNVGKTCRFFGIPRSQFCAWRARYLEKGEAGLRDGKRAPKVSPFRTPRGSRGRVCRGAMPYTASFLFDPSGIQATPGGSAVRFMNVVDENVDGTEPYAGVISVGFVRLQTDGWRISF